MLTINDLQYFVVNSYIFLSFIFYIFVPLF
ncbi:unknown [Alistipes sp. CAG:435]|nr:unknown [Alistipes sp. CAG:435]